MTFEFKPLPDERLEEAFSILQMVADEIRTLGRRQRISNTSRNAYWRWQADQSNYVVTEKEQIVGLVTICNEELSDWPNYRDLGHVQMMRSLATHPKHHGKSIGRFAVQKSVDKFAREQPIYLDCVSEFLPEFYRGLGFESLERRELELDSGELLDVTLMRSVRLSDDAPTHVWLESG